jgi:hypothetical protein
MLCRCVMWLLMPCKVSPLILNYARSKKSGIFCSYVLVYLTDAIRKEFHPDLFQDRNVVSTIVFSWHSDMHT